jgi:hypothetical protein
VLVTGLIVSFSANNTTIVNLDPDAPYEVEACGVERWSVKVLTDADASSVNISPVNTTLYNLIHLTTPSPSTTMPRQPVEKQMYTIHCTVSKIKLESDGDYHLLLTDSAGNTMIGEIPDPTCAATVSSLYIGDIKRCRQFIDAHYSVGTSFSGVNAKMVITGVAFVDPPHGQTDAAPNNLELHSILDIQYEPVNHHTSGFAESNSDGRNFTVYPNPLHDHATFRLDLGGGLLAGDAIINIFDYRGNVVKSMSWPKSEMQVVVTRDNLANGIYFYQVAGQGHMIATGKLLVE